VSKITRNISKKAGYPPGTLMYVGSQKGAKVRIELVEYNETSFLEKEADAITYSFKFKKDAVTWLNITGVHQTDIIAKIGKFLGLHPITLEAIADTSQRPKTEDFGDYLFVLLKMAYYSEEKKELDVEQVSLMVGPDYVISFQESENNAFKQIKERIRKAKGKTRQMGSDYLAYMLIDAIVDNYFVILEQIGEEIEQLEEKVLENPTPEILARVYRLKHELLFIRKSVWPMREVISNLQEGGSKIIRKQTSLYLKDIYEHTIEVIDTIEIFRDMVAGMLDIYLTSVSNKLNEIMKVLTVISTIFIPLTFIVGLYGMNFDYMPELRMKMAYPALWAVMISLSLLMVAFFRRRKWV